MYLVQFLGNDVLHVYNKQQVRYRLNHAELYIANTKPSGFSVEVSNLLHPTHVMVGVRVHVGTKSLEKVPSFVEVFGRTKTVFLTGEESHSDTHACVPYPLCNVVLLLFQVLTMYIVCMYYSVILKFCHCRQP